MITYRAVGWVEGGDRREKEGWDNSKLWPWLKDSLRAVYDFLIPTQTLERVNNNLRLFLILYG